MNPKMWLLNIFLAALIAVCAFQIMHLWQVKPKSMIDIPSPEKESRAATDFKEKNRLFEERAYELLVRQNLFSPDRQEYVPEPDAEEPEPKPEGPKISGERVALYGVVITAGRKKALINNPGGKLGKGKFLWVEEGEVTSNLRVMAIHPEEIVLNDGSAQYQILLSEKKQRSIGRKGDKRSGPTVVRGVESGRSQSGSNGDSNNNQNTTVSADGKYKIVDTPFGKIKQRIE
jgi:hypothetical protein